MSGGGDPVADINAMIKALQQLPKEIMPRVYEEFARLISDDIKATARAGTSPDGKAWAPRKDGQAAMTSVADHIEVEVVSTGVLVRLQSPEYWHHTGRAKGGVKREVIYVGDMPARIAKKLDEAATRIIGEALNV